MKSVCLRLNISVNNFSGIVNRFYVMNRFSAGLDFNLIKHKFTESNEDTESRISNNIKYCYENFKENFNRCNYDFISLPSSFRFI